MQNYQQALNELMLRREESRMLALQIWQQRGSATSNTDLIVQLHESCARWDSSAVTAVKLAPDLVSFRYARRIAPEDGLAQVVLPDYVSDRLEHCRC